MRNPAINLNYPVQIHPKSFKFYLKKLLYELHLDLTKNMQYDRQTELILNKLLSSSSNTIDIGCHKGELLEKIINLAPNGQHLAFEPLPCLFDLLYYQFLGKAQVYPFALSDENGICAFHFVTNAPAYSGIRRRTYAVKTPIIEKIPVVMKKLDDIIPKDLRVDFIKIDVEGAEFNVLKGAENTLKRNLPYVIFEFGIGGSDHYGSAPEDLFDFLNDVIGLEISIMQKFIDNKSSLSKEAFTKCYYGKNDYYFIAHPNR